MPIGCQAGKFLQKIQPDRRRAGRLTFQHEHSKVVVEVENGMTRMSGKKGALIFIDFEKAFVSVWNNGPLKKLYQSGLRGNFKRLIENFLKRQ